MARGHLPAHPPCDNCRPRDGHAAPAGGCCRLRLGRRERDFGAFSKTWHSRALARGGAHLCACYPTPLRRKPSKVSPIWRLFKTYHDNSAYNYSLKKHNPLLSSVLIDCPLRLGPLQNLLRQQEAREGHYDWFRAVRDHAAVRSGESSVLYDQCLGRPRLGPFWAIESFCTARPSSFFSRWALAPPPRARRARMHSLLSTSIHCEPVTQKQKSGL